MEVLIMPATMGMKGAGYYDRHSTAQLSAIQALDGWIDDAVASVRLPAGTEPTTVLDLGSSEGGNSVRVMASVAASLRRRTDQPLRVIYSDLASNDFNRLFANLEEARRSGPSAPHVYPGAVAGSFYGALLPPGTVHLATIFNAIHWLDRLPEVPLRDHVIYRRPNPRRPGLASPPEVVAAFERQAGRDLTRFLESQARELAPGARLLVAAPGDSDEVCFSEGLCDVANDAALDLVADGRIRREAYERLTIPCYFRTVDELLAPLEREGSSVRGAFAVDRFGVLKVRPPFVIAFERDGDAPVYASACADFLRAVTEPVVRTALGPRAEEAGAIEGFYERIRARLNAEPGRYPWEYILVAVSLTRL